MIKGSIRKAAVLSRQAATGHLGWLRGALGGALGIILSGTITLLFIGADHPSLPWLVAPIGASAVLVFSIPASPLAQPWNVVGGNLLSAMIGLAVGHWLGIAWLSAGIAVGLAIAAMSLTRSLHPPGGACALLCALGVTGPLDWHWTPLLSIMVNVLILASVGWVYNNLTGHPWPHRPPAPTENIPTTAELSYTQEDLEAVLSEWDEVLDVDTNDLDALFRALERRVLKRLADERLGKHTLIP